MSVQKTLSHNVMYIYHCLQVQVYHFFEDTEHLRLILLLFCQQVAIRKHAGCSRSGSKKLGKSELRLLPRPKLKTASVRRFCGNVVGGTLLWPIRLVLHNFHTSSKKPIRFLNKCEIYKIISMQHLYRQLYSYSIR